MTKRCKPTMTRAHYELIAETLRDLYEDLPLVLSEREREEFLAVRFASALVGTNPAFDRERFIAACLPKGGK